MEIEELKALAKGEELDFLRPSWSKDDEVWFKARFVCLSEVKITGDGGLPAVIIEIEPFSNGGIFDNHHWLVEYSHPNRLRLRHERVVYHGRSWLDTSHEIHFTGWERGEFYSDLEAEKLKNFGFLKWADDEVQEKIVERPLKRGRG